MQLDKTRITIRERSNLELCDLALRVIRKFSPALLVSLAVGVVPLAVLNWLLLGDLPEPETTAAMARYYWNLTLLVFLEAPLATAAGTVFLGDAMFLHPPALGTVLRRLRPLLWRLLICLGLIRGPLIGIALAATLDPWTTGPADFLLPLTALIVLFIRSLRPFLSEIILLEENPLRAQDPRAITIGRRSSKLHGPNGGDLLGRHLFSMLLAVMLTVAVSFTFWFASGTLMNDWTWGPVMTHIAVPLAMWLAAGYFAVVRYLSYLDLRIRREGWAVELRLRAEAARLTKQFV